MKYLLITIIAISVTMVWILYPSTNVWENIMDGDIEAVQTQIDDGFDIKSECPGINNKSLKEKWNYWSKFKWPPFKFKGVSAMHIALRQKKPKMVQLLVDNGAAWPRVSAIIGLGEKNLAKNYIQQGGRLTLGDLIDSEKKGLIAWLIKQGLELGPDKNTMLHWAAIYGETEVVETLIKHDAKATNVWKLTGNTPLHGVIFGANDRRSQDNRNLKGRASIIKLLLANGADVNAKNKAGERPLDWAFGIEDLYNPLRENGGKPGKISIILQSARNLPYLVPPTASTMSQQFGLSPSDEEMKQNEKHENEMAILIRELVIAGHDINANEKEFISIARYPYWFTVESDGDGDGFADEYEVSFGYDPLDSNDTPTDSYDDESDFNEPVQMKPLMMALKVGYSSKTVSLLLELGSDVNAKNKDGETPLDFANRVKRTEFAELLRKHGGKTGEELKAEIVNK
jgi:ankyrin repeat protein